MLNRSATALTTRRPITWLSGAQTAGKSAAAATIKAFGAIGALNALKESAGSRPEYDPSVALALTIQPSMMFALLAAVQLTIDTVLLNEFVTHFVSVPDVQLSWGCWDFFIKSPFDKYSIFKKYWRSFDRKLKDGSFYGCSTQVKKKSI